MTISTEFKHLNSEAAILAAFHVMQELRPHLQNAQSFASQIARQHAQGYRLLAAFDQEKVLGLAGYRLQENLLYGKFIYVDDLVVTASVQRSGLGGQLIDAVRTEAVTLGCRNFVLDTGLGMALAQRFYFRQGLLAKGMHFAEVLVSEGAN